MEDRVRAAPLGARLLALAFAEDWNVPDDPLETDLLFDTPFSPEAVPEPGLLPFDADVLPGAPPPPSAGEGGGAGGNRGRGQGSGAGDGVGSGGPRGCCEGAFHAASLDREPALVFKPADPPYPPEARARGVRGEVILQIVVRADGSTSVENVLRTLPYCTEIARELATRYRWKPGLKDGRPVDTIGILIVRFDLVGSPGA
jgi:Gram-negative bacterial TonB protein C-terminal